MIRIFTLFSTMILLVGCASYYLKDSTNEYSKFILEKNFSDKNENVRKYFEDQIRKKRISNLQIKKHSEKHYEFVFNVENKHLLKINSLLSFQDIALYDFPSDSSILLIRKINQNGKDDTVLLKSGLNFIVEKSHKRRYPFIGLREYFGN